MITRSTKLKLLAFAVVAVLGMAYLGFKYVGLDRALLGGGYEVAADFSDSGGIFVNAEVTYRGVAVGRVTDMDLVDDGVRVELRIDPDADPIPADTDGGRRDPECGGGAVRPPAADTVRVSPTSRTARSSRRSAPASRCRSSRCSSTSTSSSGRSTRRTCGS